MPYNISIALALEANTNPDSPNQTNYYRKYYMEYLH